VTNALELWIHASPADRAAMPASHAVVAFFDAADACVLLAATADARAFCDKRVPAADSPGTPARVSALPSPSMFEAELAYLHAARRLLPDTYAGLIDAWKPWFLRLDPARGTWSPTNLHDHAPGSLLFGPMPDKHAPPRLGEALDDAFDLCRHPAELAKAPAGRACPYKEMGRCPAPCDGSEPLPAFLERFAAAARALDSRDALVAAIEARMAAAAARAEFERAAHLKDLARRLTARGGRGLAHFAPLHAFARVAVVPSAAAGAGVYLCRADGITPLGRLHLEDTNPEPTGGASLQPARAPDLSTRIASTAPLPPDFFPTPHQREELGLVTRRLFAARTPESFLTVNEASDPRILRRAARPNPGPEREPRSDRR
jgi:hypothetical protein